MKVAPVEDQGFPETARCELPSSWQRCRGEPFLDFGRRLHRAQMLRLRMKHRAGMNGRGVVLGRSQLVDHLVREAFKEAFCQNNSQTVNGNGIAILALGGYGREELAPHSDVDLMFLRKKTRVSPEARQIQAMLCLLWDMGFEVGHSVRTVQESLQLAQGDLVSQLSMLDCRLLVGDWGLASDLKRNLQQSLTSRPKLFQEKVLASVEDRHRRQGGTAFIQEPNVKETKGGLRDFQVIRWLFESLFPGGSLKEFLFRHGLSGQDWTKAQAAYDFMQRVRNELHFQAGRRDDRLTHTILGQVLQCFSSTDLRVTKSGEVFLKHYYRQAGHVASLLQNVLQPIKAKPQTVSLFKFVTKLTLGRHRRPSPVPVGSMPEDWVLALRSVQSEPERLHWTARSKIRESLGRFRQSDFSTEALGESFRAILGHKGRVAKALRFMHELKLLGRILPEFGKLTCMVQQDRYHKYTVDEHSLRAMDVLDEITQGNQPGHSAYQQVLGEVHDVATLSLALLMHDVGKGWGRNHAERGARLVEQAATRLGFDPDEVDKARQLVHQHLLMSHVSQRRNLEDPETIDHFVEQVGRLEVLNMLVLMTYADGQAVAPGVWSAWKDYCLWDLYYKAYDRLMLAQENSVAGRAQVEKIQKKVVNLLHAEMDPAYVEQHFQLLPEQYAIYTRLEHVVAHLRLAASLNNSTARFSWLENPGRGCSELVLVARDQPGLFAQVAGAITSFNLSILSAQLNTRRDGMVCNVFLLGSLNGGHSLRNEDFPRAERFIENVLSKKVDLREEVKSRQRRYSTEHTTDSLPSPKVRLDNDISPRATVIEVQAGDRIGLGYQIARALAELRLNIIFAKLATEKSHAFDVFYVQNSEGQKVSDLTEMAQVSDRLQIEVNSLVGNKDPGC